VGRVVCDIPKAGRLARRIIRQIFGSVVQCLILEIAKVDVRQTVILSQLLTNLIRRIRLSSVSIANITVIRVEFLPSAEVRLRFIFYQELVGLRESNLLSLVRVGVLA
jgi:hypothetical protein